jgi:hypothetical protein
LIEEFSHGFTRINTDEKAKGKKLGVKRKKDERQNKKREI